MKQQLAMPEFRQDPLSGSWVIVAAGRAARPQDYQDAGQPLASARCPFCRGHEEDTPQASASYCLQDSGQSWQVRVVPNKYPAVDPDAQAQPGVPGVEGPLLPGAGRHEVIIESPEHHQSLVDLSPRHRLLVLQAYRDRLRSARRDARWRYGLIFKNLGAAAGASLEHVHSQLIATALLPDKVAREVAHCRQHYERHGGTLLRTMLQRELQYQQRLVARTPRLTAFCPFASRTAYECWIVPRASEARFEDQPDEQLEELAELLGALLTQLEQTLPQPAYNLLLHTAPFDSSVTEYYHWRMEILPRITKLAGFEWATGCYINPILPEEAARKLRLAPSVG